MTFEEKEIVEQDDFSMWMSLREAVGYFNRLTVCRVNDWHEVRMPGKFVRTCDIEDDYYEAVLSKYYYHIEVDSNSLQKVFVTMFQEDERRKGVILRRPNRDISLAVLRCTPDGVELYDLKDFIIDR